MHGLATSYDGIEQVQCNVEFRASLPSLTGALPDYLKWVFFYLSATNYCCQGDSKLDEPMVLLHRT